jgi:hypothetical protein
MSYPDLVEDRGKYYITETQKDVARVHEIDPALLDGLWKQFTIRERTLDGLVGDWHLEGSALPRSVEAVRIDPFYGRDPGRGDHGGMLIRSGFTLDIAFRLDDLASGQTLIDTRNESGKGFQLSTTPAGKLTLSLGDGRTTSSWSCDRGMLEPGRDHYMSVIVDGGPRIILFVVDGILCDGGEERQFGWGRFNPYLHDLNGTETWTLGKDLRGSISGISVYNRALRVSEAIGNYRSHTRKK